MPAAEKRMLYALAGVQFTNILDFMIMMPLGPQLTRLFGISDAQFGGLVSAYTFAAGISSLLAVFYIDRFDRRRLFLTIYALFAVATLACALAPSYATLLSARTAAGVFGGVLSSLVLTLVAEAVPFERRGQGMGIVMTGFSVVTVVGVPLGLWLASLWSWHAPFVFIAAVAVPIWLLARHTLPRASNVIAPSDGAWWRQSWLSLRAVTADANHWRAFAMNGLTMFSSFLVIPYITLGLQANAGLTDAQIPLIYLCGGIATIFTARWIGAAADRLGKVRVYQRLMALAAFALLAMTLLPRLPIAVILAISTAFFVVVSGRNIPGMALVGAAALPEHRGAFQTINSSITSASIGMASFIGGLIIERAPDGHIERWWMNALLGAVASGVAIWLAPRLRVR
jgi:predicted MFS family arabinose efflux permease